MSSWLRLGRADTAGTHNQQVPLCLISGAAFLWLVCCIPSQSSTIHLLLAAEEC